MANESHRKCPDCENIDSNSLFDKGNGKCRKCEGTGHDRHAEALTLGLVGNYSCNKCSGTGQCQSCGGTGYAYYNEVKDDNPDTNEELHSTWQREADTNDPGYDIIRAAVERKMENEASWLEIVFWRIPKFLFWQLPGFLFTAIAGLFRKPISNDALYMELVFLLLTMREQTVDRTAASFDARVNNLQYWLDTKCKLDNTKITGAQRIFVNTVRSGCEMQADKLRSIVDQLIVVRKSPNSGPGFILLLKELDNVFKPIDGEDGSVVILRAAQAS